MFWVAGGLFAAPGFPPDNTTVRIVQSLHFASVPRTVPGRCLPLAAAGCKLVLGTTESSIDRGDFPLEDWPAMLDSQQQILLLITLLEEYQQVEILSEDRALTHARLRMNSA